MFLLPLFPEEFQVKWTLAKKKKRVTTVNYDKKYFRILNFSGKNKIKSLYLFLLFVTLLFA